MNGTRSATSGIFIAGAVALTLLSAGCSNEVALRIAPDPGMIVSLSGDVQPIFTRSCAFVGCHGDLPSLNLDLRAGNSWGSLVNVQSVQAPALDRVEPGDSAKSYIVHKLQGTQDSVGGTGNRMPNGGQPFLPDAEIDLIRSWIDQGAADN